MQAVIRIGLRQEFDNEEINEMYRLRARVFKDRMGWDVPTIAGMEIDGYDALGPHYMLIKGGGAVCGCWRLMPTEGPNMLRDTFPQLLHGDAAPTGRHIWELSRFAIEAGGEQAFGFADVTMHAIHSLVTFADHESQQRWREHVAHREAQRQGRAGWYAAYSIQVSDCTRAHEFPT